MKGDTIRIRLNSGGGDVYEAVAIYNDLCQHPARVSVTITGLAASAASLICCAADEILMTPGSRMMLHNSWCFGEGNADYFESLIKELHSIDQSMAEFYAARSGKPIEEIKALMQADPVSAPRKPCAWALPTALRAASRQSRLWRAPSASSRPCLS